ncbi:hypothetical protein D5085_10785 [Ectothiorhodospiraceae bacterium BW-2]|nr:hypothetical protein D5085_10785 [Ectothiorhodospiraceae bacterium BW-2]
MANKSVIKGHIQSISIEGFRSILQVEQLQLGNLSVLIGANGAGKSNFIRLFELISWMLKGKKLQEFVITHGGGDDQFFMGARKTPRIRIEISIQTNKGDNDYRFALTHLPAGDSVLLTEEAYRYSDSQKRTTARWTELASASKEAQLPDQVNSTAKIVVHLLRNCATYQFHDTSAQASIHKRWDVNDFSWLRSDGGNLAAVLLHLQECDPMRYRLITRQIERVLPTFDDFVLVPVAGRVELRWKSRQSDKTFGAHLTSDGSLRLFCLLTLLNLPTDPLSVKIP